jgi:uncharacterized membrane protein YhaH (DUF805 family)
MINESDKVNDKLRFLEKMMDFKGRDLTLLFWFFALLTIPIFTYLYTLPFSLFLWMISKLFSLSEKTVGLLTKFAVIASFVFATGTQFYIWKRYKNK